jgi:hypothetical protein
MLKFAKCHPNKPYKAKDLCRNCYDKQLRDSNPHYKERQKANARKWAKENPERIKKIQDKKNQRYKNSPEIRERIYINSIIRKYNITKEEYFKLLEQSNNKCMICFSDPTGNKRLHVDHCHKTGKIRGLLCAECNWYIRKFEIIPNLSEKIHKYLVK